MVQDNKQYSFIYSVKLIVAKNATIKFLRLDKDKMKERERGER